MIKITNQITIGRYTVITLDSPTPRKAWNTVRISGVDYATEIVYDMPNSIAVIGSGDFEGKEIIFI